MKLFARSILCLVLSLAATVPFLNKAFHIDDVLYLFVAQQILIDPLRPYGDRSTTMVMWDAENGAPATLFDTDFNPPLWKYVLASSIAFGGTDERVLHAVSALFVFVGSLGWAACLQRWCSRPIWGVSAIVCSPFFLPGQNLMLEVPVYCFAGWGMYFQSRAWQSDPKVTPWRDSLAAGFCIGAALLTKYSAGALLPVLLLGSLLCRRPRAAISLVPAILLLAGWCGHNLVFYGELHLTSHGNLFKPEEWPLRVMIILRTIGGVSLLWPLLLAQVGRGPRGKSLLLLTTVLSGLLAAVDLRIVRALYEKDGLIPLPIQEGHVVAMTFFGSLTVLLLVVRYLQNITSSQEHERADGFDHTLAVWTLGLLVFNVACTPFNAVRHLLLAFIPMTIFVTRRLASNGTILEKSTLAASAGLAFLLAAADFEIANTYRTIAETNVRRDIARGDPVWFTGNWGFTFYSARQGARPLFVGTEQFGIGRPEPGDRIYNPVIITWKPLETRGMEWTEHLQPEGIIPFRTIAPGTQFYSVNGNGLPWSFFLLPPRPKEGRDGYQFPPLDHIRVWTVREPNPSPSPWVGE